MSVDSVLRHLEKVRETGANKWVACCPAHEDRSPSLAVKEGSDGRVLLHCFAGCEVEDILGAVGLTFSDIMPERLPEHRYEPQRPYFDARQVLECISHEAMVVALIAEQYAVLVSPADGQRLLKAKSRISRALYAGPPLKTPPELKTIRRAN